MRIAILWTNLSGYSAACWRRLAEQPGVELSITTLVSGASTKNTAFNDELGAGLPITSFDPAELTAEKVTQSLRAFGPDAILLVGWATPPYVEATLALGRDGCRTIMTMDNPWQGDWRQWVTCVRRRKLLAKFDHVLVPGARSQQFARHLGVPWDKLSIGMYAYDDALCVPQPVDPGPPRRFLFVGRYVPSKGLGELLAAYTRYAGAVDDPFELVCHGTGPMAQDIAKTPGVTDGGFIQPAALPAALGDAAALVLPSHHEHWGVIVAEALACARPVICTKTTGSIPELVRDHYNGQLVGVGDAAGLAHALGDLAGDSTRWRTWAARAPALAAPFTATRWAQRIARLCGQA